MRKLLILSLLLPAATIATLAQDHQTNKKTLSRHLREVYNVVKTDWKIKDSTYSVINDAGLVVVKGNYVQGKKSGIWIRAALLHQKRKIAAH